MAYEYSTNTMSIGTTYTPSGANKYITVQGVSVEGLLTAPEYAATILMGTGTTVTAATTVSASTAIIVPTHGVDPSNDFIYFDIVPQVDYVTNGTKYRDTQMIRIKINTPEPTGMTNFVVGPTFLPFIKSIATGTPAIELQSDGSYKIKLIITIDQLDIPASGNASVKVPLAI